MSAIIMAPTSHWYKNIHIYIAVDQLINNIFTNTTCDLQLPTNQMK